MKHSSILATILLVSIFSVNLHAKGEVETATSVLQKVSDQLNSFETISYCYYRSINYFSEDYHSETSGHTYLDFRSNDSTLGFKFQLENEQYKMVYNGSEAFHLNKKEKSIEIHRKPDPRDFESLSLFANSIVSIRQVLPMVISDKDIIKKLADTSINGKNHYLVTFVLKNMTIGNIGGFNSLALKRNISYRLVVDKTSHMPLQIIQTNDAEPNDYVLTVFKHTEKSGKSPDEHSWYYSTYLDDYQPSSLKKLAMVQPNTKATDWLLPFIDGCDTLRLSSLKGKVVLLEFWIKNCGYCISAVSELNGLWEKYHGKNLQVIGVNAYDSRGDICSFYKKNQPKFRTVYDYDGNVTRDYGVDAFPTIVLLDGNHKILYAGDFDQVQLNNLLKVILK